MKKISLQTCIILTAAMGYLACFSFFSIRAHQGLQTQMNDLGSMDQAVWLASQGDFYMPASNLAPGEGQMGSRLAVHANFIFWLLGFVYRLWPGPELLLVLTSLACALAGVGLYLFARARLGSSRWCLVPPLAFWLSPLVHDANLFDFHILTFAAAFIVWAVWAFETRRPGMAWVFVFLAMICQEDISPILFMLGIYLVFAGQPRQGVVLMLVSALYAFFLLGVVNPYLNGGKQLVRELSYRYEYLGRTPSEVLMSMVRHPEKVFSVMLRLDHLRLPAYFLVCGAFAGLCAWPMLLLLLPPMSLGLLSQIAWSTRLTGSYYWVICEAVIIMACVLAAEKNIKRKGPHFSLGLTYLGAATVALSLIFSPLPYGIGASWENFSLLPERETLKEAAGLIPQDAPVCVQNNLGPHLPHRRWIQTYPSRCDAGKAQYLLFHLRYTAGPNSGFFVRSMDILFFQVPVSQLLKIVEGLLVNSGWNLVFQKDGFYLFARGAAQKAAPEAAMLKFREDARQMEEAYKAANRHAILWAGYMTSIY